MTSIITISCPNGVIMGADSRITRINRQTGNITYDDNISKIHKLENYNIAISYWGNTPANSNFQAILDDFEASLDDQNETVDTIGNKLMTYLENHYPGYNKEMGFHIAGLIDEDGIKPRIRHIFHVNIFPPGIFINENCNQEYHNGIVKLTYAIEKKYLALFNGENSISNAFFNLIPQAFGDRELYVESLSLGECAELAELIIKTTTQILKFYASSHKLNQRANPITGGDIVIISITNTGFNDIKNYHKLKGDEEDDAEN